MAYLYFSKFSINSTSIFDIYDGHNSLESFLNTLFKNVNDTHEYKPITNQAGYSKYEIYNFSELTKFSNEEQCFITGLLVRRHPKTEEEFNSDTRKSQTKYRDKNASTTRFYLDVKNEIFTYCERNSFGTKQINSAMKELLSFFAKTRLEVFPLQDPRSIHEQLQQVHKVTKIKTIVIPPNVNEEHLKNLLDDDIKEMKEARTTSKTTLYEIDQDNDEGINVNSTLITKALDINNAYKKYQMGYGRIEAEGYNKEGILVKFDSQVDSSYTLVVPEYSDMSPDEFISFSKEGIQSYLNIINLLAKEA